MTIDTKPLLKGFGAAADVAGQIATDKAVNSRRVRSDFLRFDLSNGQLLKDVTSDANGQIAHGLKRIPEGAIVLKSENPVIVIDTNSTVITLDQPGEKVTVWVV